MVSGMNGAQALVAVLKAQQTEVVFGLCGHTNVAVLAELERSPIRFVPVLHEQIASHAADAYARRKGLPGVVLTHLGPGLTNVVTGVANAALDAVPLVVLTGNVQSYFFGRHAHMETLLKEDADQASCLEPWVKRTWRVVSPDGLIPALEAAFRTSLAGRPGPVLVDIAMDVFSSAVPTGPVEPKLSLPQAPGLEPRVAAAMAAVLRDASKPVIVAGSGVNQSNGGEALLRLAELLAAPVAYSLLGKGSVPDDHPLIVGMTGFWGRPEANSATREADVVLAVGTSFSELDTSSWRPGITYQIPPTRLLHIHQDSSEIGRSYRPELSAVAESRAALTAIAEALGPGTGRKVQLSPQLQQLRQSFDEDLREAQTSDSMPIRPERVLADLRKVLPRGGILVGDTGWNKNGVGQQFPMYEPRTLLVPGGYATMGFGPSAAIGAVLAEPHRQVVALVGDGAFLTNLSVVATAVQLGIPVVWGVMNNGTYATISGMSKRHFNTDYGATFDAGKLDYPAFARSVGAQGVRIEKAADLVGTFTDALDSGRPTVIDIPCTTDAVPTTGVWDINDLFGRG